MGLRGKWLIPTDRSGRALGLNALDSREKTLVFFEDLKHESVMGTPTAFWAVVWSFFCLRFWGFLLTKYWSSDPLENITKSPKTRSNEFFVFLKNPRNPVHCSPTRYNRIRFKKHLMKITLFAWTFHWFIWFSFRKEPSNLIKPKSFESNHKFLRANLSETPSPSVYLVPLTPFLLSSIFINLAGAKLTRINHFFFKFTSY